MNFRSSLKLLSSPSEDCIFAYKFIPAGWEKNENCKIFREIETQEKR